MSTEQTQTQTTPDTQTASTSSSSQSQTSGNTDSGGQQQSGQTGGDQGKTPDPKSGDKSADQGDLLFGKKPEGDADKVDQKPDAAGQRDYLKGKLKPEELEGKSDEDVAKLFDAEKQKEADADPTNQPFKLDELKIPDTMPIPEEMKGKVDDLSKIFNDKKLTNTQKMQKAVDLHVEMMQRQNQQWADTKKNWRDDCSKDPVIGGDKLKPAVSATENLITQFAGNPEFGGSPELLEQMQDDLVFLGLGNKKSFIKFMNNIARATGEDGFDGKGGGGKSSQDKSLAQKMWPDMPGDKQA